MVALNPAYFAQEEAPAFGGRLGHDRRIGTEGLGGFDRTQPKNRVGDFFCEARDCTESSRPAALILTIEIHLYIYDPASGCYKYLYAHGNPVMGVDPSGNRVSLANLAIGSAVGGILAALVNFAIRFDAASEDDGDPETIDREFTSLVNALAEAELSKILRIAHGVATSCQYGEGVYMNGREYFQCDDFSGAVTDALNEYEDDHGFFRYFSYNVLGLVKTNDSSRRDSVVILRPKGKEFRRTQGDNIIIDPFLVPSGIWYQPDRWTNNFIEVMREQDYLKINSCKYEED